MKTHCVVMIFILAFMDVPGCSTDRRGTPGQEEYFQDSRVLGKWYLNEWTWYNELHFRSDSTLAIQNHVDTIFWYRYRIRGNRLELLADGKVTGISQILVLTPDTLILKQLLSTGATLHYSRQNRLAPSKGPRSSPMQ